MKATIVGGSGYVGGEMLRLLSFHPQIHEIEVTSEQYAGKYVKQAHPNLRRLDLRFTSAEELEDTDILFSCLPHGKSFEYLDKYLTRTDHIIDLSADFRLNNADDYKKYYSLKHPYPELLDSFVYGIPELHREEMTGAFFVSSAGCNATASILPLKPLIDSRLSIRQISIDAKVGVSESGRQTGNSSSFVERERSVRSYRLTGHRHVAEIVQELNLDDVPVFSASSIPIVRGVLVTIQVILSEKVEEKDIWKIYRQRFQNEPFVDLVKERSGNFRYPDPKTLMGSNFNQIGFELDRHRKRIVLVSALDNLMKGAAGQAVQAMNLVFGFEETTGLGFPGLYVY